MSSNSFSWFIANMFEVLSFGRNRKSMGRGGPGSQGSCRLDVAGFNSFWKKILFLATIERRRTSDGEEQEGR